MAEPRDDKVSAAFRAMHAAEPPPAIDDAIRAAARRAVKAKPETALRRWAVPASVAAVLALSIGIAMHVDWRKPMVVDGTPVPSGSGEYPVTQEPAEAPPPRIEVPRAKPVAKDAAGMNAAPESKATAAPAERREAKPDVAAAPAVATMAAPSPAAAAKPVAPPAPPAALPAAPQAFPAPSAPSQVAPAASAPPPPAMARMQAGVVAPASRAAASTSGADQASAEVAPLRAKREAAGASVAKEAAPTTPEKQLERIAELRASGRHTEADEALAKFRRDYPDYRIPPETWEKVKSR